MITIIPRVIQFDTVYITKYSRKYSWFSNVWAVLDSPEKTEMARVLEPKLSIGTWIMRMSVTIMLEY